MPDLVAKAAAKVPQLRVPSETSITAVCEGLLDVIRSLMNVPPPGRPDGFPAQLGERPDHIVEAVCRRARSILEIVGASGQLDPKASALGVVQAYRVRALTLRYLFMLEKVDVEDVWYAFLEAHTAAESTLEQHDVLTLDIALDRAVFMYEAERDIVGALGVINKALGPVDGLPKAESRILADQP